MFYTITRKRILLLTVACVLLFNSCKNKTEQLLTKKWDCIKVENLNLENERFQNPQDSINTVQLVDALQSISWTFKDGHQYECSVGGKIMVQGSYGLMNDGKTLVCTPDSKNIINHYTINSITENDLVLSSSTGNAPLVLHFRPH